MVIQSAFNQIIKCFIDDFNNKYNTTRAYM